MISSRKLRAKRAARVAPQAPSGVTVRLNTVTGDPSAVARAISREARLGTVQPMQSPLSFLMFGPRS